MQRILVWDLPTRFFHWILALSFAAAWLTSESDVWLSLHVFVGYVMLGLLGFRLLWGFVGGHYARFAAFRFGPKAGLAYLRETLTGRAARHIGHNPAGSQAIYLLLALLLVIGLSGIFALGGEEQHGAAAGWLSLTSGRVFKTVHEAGATFMLFVVGGHIAAVLLESLLHKENLARSMLTGTKLAPAGTPPSRPYPLVAVTLLLALAGFALWWFSYALQGKAAVGIDDRRPTVAFVGASLVQNAAWNEECGSCHLSYHPSLLPARSWQLLLAQQDRHFGADLALDSATTATLLGYAGNNAAGLHQTEAAFKIDSSIAAAAAPLRITETPYWVKKHRDVAAADWALPWIKSKANCAACHQDAQAGTFEDAAMSIPRSAAAAKPL
jgi:cytochrome b